MRSSAAFLFKPAAATAVSNTSALSTSCHPTGHASTAAAAAEPSHSSVVWPDRGRRTPPAARASAGADDAAARHHDRQSRHIPRPLTIRQLWWAYLSLSTCAAAATGPCADIPGTTARLGDAAMCLDGSPCSAVVVCGRVLARHGPDANGSARQRHPYSLLVLTDHTAALCVLQYHTLVAAPSRGNERDPPALAAETWPPASATAVTARCETCFSDAPWPRSLVEEDATTENAAALNQKAEEVAEAGAAHAQHSTAFDDHFQTWRRTTTPFADAAALTGTPPGADFFSPDEVIADAELEICPGDYVVCTGRLCYTDVEPSLRTLFSGMTLASPAETLRRAATSTASSTRTSAPSHDDDDDDDVVQASTVRDDDTVTHAWLPHAEAPVRLEDLSVLGLTRAALPTGTRFLTLSTDSAAEEVEALLAAAPLPSTTRPSTLAAIGASGEEASPVIPFVVKGKVSLLTDSNEWMYWTLSALHTHLRLTRHTQSYEL